ncbi:hypothetical protein CRE_30156 [Caenorhabditis remanei]|uniref:Uncharacterized protein n=1 Tax=Caenorhabditis remanei TaxID=31234 RepID=E3NAK6_CAERE|nr:hypothetical protein CRE_30156 [Caenorhabditis remanei]
MLQTAWSRSPQVTPDPETVPFT